MTRRWLCLDFETTGLPISGEENLDKQPHAIELGIVEVVDNQVTREKAWLLQPGILLDAIITKITGLTNADLVGKPRFSEIYQEVVQDWFLGAQGMVAHNLPFDRQILLFELQRLGKEYAFPYPPTQLCTVQVFHHLAGRRLKLLELYERVIGRPLNQTHRALDDVHAMVEVLIKEQVLQ